MKLVEWLNKELTPLQLFSWLAMLCLVFVIPLILADCFYHDDNWRTQLAVGLWTGDGRLAQDLFYRAVSFTGGAPNLFPLPLLLAALAMAAALGALTRHYFGVPTLGKALVVLPLWYSPFFLQNLTYQYDGPGMALGVVAALCSVTYKSPVRWKYYLIPGLWVALALLFYQLVIEVLAGLYCIEVLCAARARWPSASWYRHLYDKFLQWAIGVAVYAVVVYPVLRHNERVALLTFDYAGLAEVRSRLTVLAGYLGLLINDGNRWMALPILALAIIGWLMLAGRTLSLPERPAHRMVLVGLLLAASALLLFSVAGATLPFEEFVAKARTFIGLGPLGVAIFYLVHCALHRCKRYTPLVLCVPLACMLSFSFAYGRVLQMQKLTFERLALQLSFDLSGNDQLRSLQRYYLINEDNNGGWLPGAYHAMELLPALKYVLNVDFWLAPEMMARYGVAHISEPRGNDPFFDRPRPPPIVENPIYDIYIEGSAGYVVTRPARQPQQYDSTMHRPL